MQRKRKEPCRLDNVLQHVYFHIATAEAKWEQIAIED